MFLCPPELGMIMCFGAKLMILHLIGNSSSLLCAILNELLQSDLDHLLSEHLLSILELGGRDS